jgi:hypothetical protein
LIYRLQHPTATTNPTASKLIPQNFHLDLKGLARSKSSFHVQLVQTFRNFVNMASETVITALKIVGFSTYHHWKTGQR